MTRKINKSDGSLDPDSPEDDRFLSDEWSSKNGAFIDVTIDVTSWHALLIDDFKTRGPMMLDFIGAHLSLSPQNVSLFLCNDAGMRAMNNRHRGVDRVTNILSFPNGEKLQLPDVTPTNELAIGDIAIAGETVLREAKDASIAAGDHLLHLFTHGILHLLGYDHEQDSAAAEMERLEIILLAQMKIANPYYGDESIFDIWEHG